MLRTVILANCQRLSCKKHGRNRNGSQRYKCQLCQATFSEETVKPLGELRLSVEHAAQALSLLLEGMSVRSAARITGLRPNTICDLIVVVGENCARFLPEAVNGVAATGVQCDELWSSWLAVDRKRNLSLGHACRASATAPH
jgi:transposase-like protein